VVVACSNAIVGVLLDTGREGVQNLLPGLEKMSVVSSSSPSPALIIMSSQALFFLPVLGGSGDFKVVATKLSVYSLNMLARLPLTSVK
jgi:hypothetical protein